MKWRQAWRIGLSNFNPVDITHLSEELNCQVWTVKHSEDRILLLWVYTPDSMWYGVVGYDLEYLDGEYNANDPRSILISVSEAPELMRKFFPVQWMELQL